MTALVETPFNTMQEIEAIIEDERWDEAPFSVSDLAEECHEAAVKKVPELAAAVALLLADDARLQKLNAEFRHKNQPTNVLSFPSGGRAPALLGDIALAFETCAKESEVAGLPLRDHTAHLIVHGLLHLVGYDHQTEEDAGVMEPLETEILAQMGIADPYGVSS